MAQTVIKEVLPDLDVTTIYESLMETSTGKHSAYIKAKESLLEYFGTIEDSSLSGVGVGNQLSAREKAEMLSKLVSEMAVSITGAAMQTSVKIATENRDAPYTLTKLRVDTEAAQANVLKIEADTAATGNTAAKIEADKNLSVIQGWKIQSDLYRDNGVSAIPAISSTILNVTPANAHTDTYGLKYESMRKSKADTYDKYASSIMQYGKVAYTPGTDGTLSTAVPATAGLTYAQTNVAIRQEQAFDDNMRQHAANSSANMIGLLLSTENSSALDTNDVNTWRANLNYLSGYSLFSASINITAPGVITKATGITISGTSVNVPWGANVTISITSDSNVSSNAIGIVDTNGTWSVAVTSTALSALALGACTVKATVDSINHSIVFATATTTLA